MNTDNSTSNICPKCSGTKFYKSGKCADCSKAYSAAYRKANPEKVKASVAQWAASNPEKKQDLMRKWRSENVEKIAAYDAAHRIANLAREREVAAAYRAANPQKRKQWADKFRISNKEKIAKGNAEYYVKNAEQMKAKTLAWQKENPDACRIKNQNRRAQKVSSGKLSKGLAQKLFNLQKGKCPCCKQPLGDDYHLDHIIPLSRGGLNIDSNIQLLREVCNHQKHARHPVEFMRSRGFLL
jgi:5-methylcytosine-specific restriction endonuclease McrA/uncharacterized Zn finger protein (UPF0148 family)